MTTNERGGIISKILLIPAGVALMAGFFFLGYYVGKYQSRSLAQNQRPAPLPEVEPINPPKQDEFTFYKTLTEKENKTVSIDLNPKPEAEEKRADKKPADGEPARNKTAALVQALPKQQVPAKKEAASKLRYTLQLASYQEKEMAEEDVKRMKQRGFAAFVVASAVEGKGTWYRVRLGSFSNKASAEKLQRELRAKEGVSAFITIE